MGSHNERFYSSVRLRDRIIGSIFGCCPPPCSLTTCCGSTPCYLCCPSPCCGFKDHWCHFYSLCYYHPCSRRSYSFEDFHHPNCGSLSLHFCSSCCGCSRPSCGTCSPSSSP